MKLFNAPALAGAATEDADAADQTVLTPVFTDENGAPKAGIIRKLTPNYPVGGGPATHGAFDVSAKGKSIRYTAPTKVGNITSFDVVATYTADDGTLAVAGQLADENTVTVTVTPVNDPPAVAIVEPVAAINEGQPVSFTITVADEENGAFDYFVYRQDGAQWVVVEGTWAGLIFTSTETPDNGVVVHPNLTKVVNLKVEAVDTFDGQTTASAPAPVTIHDVDQLVSAPTDATIVPDPAYVTDELDVTFTPAVDTDQEDVVTYTYKWTNELARTVLTSPTVPAGTAKKGEIWTVVVTANSFGDDSEDSAPAQITISNSLPTVANGTLFIQKGEGLPKSKDIDLAALATDPDGHADVVGMIVTDPTKGTLDHKEGTVYTYTVTGDDEFFGANADTFTFKAKDASGDDSAVSATVFVTYRTNPPPVFVAESATGVDAAGYDEVDANNAATVVNVSVQVGDTDNAGGTVPGAGVAQVVWNLALKDAPPMCNGVDPNSWLQYAGVPGISGETIGVVPCTINFPGFDTIAGSDRPASLTFVLSVVATDGNEGGGAESEPFFFPDIVIRDVDRAPTAPTSIAFDPAGDLFTGDTVNALAAGFTDPDGDDLVGNKYAWTLENAKLTNPGLSPLTAVPALIENGGTPCAWPFARELIKGDALTVAAVAVTAPAYAPAARKESPAFTSASLTVSNTAPEFVTAADANWQVFESATGTEEAVQALAFAWEIISRNDAPILVANDIDAAAFQTAAGVDYVVDSLVFSIDPAADDADYDPAVSGPVVIGQDGKSLVYTPKQHYNGAFIVGVKVTDQSGASATYLLTVTVNAVNDQPVADVADVYAVPSDCDGTTVHIKYFPVYPGGDDEGEAEQLLLQAGTGIVANDPNGIILNGTLAAVVINGFDAAGAITDAAFVDADVLNDLDGAAALAKLFASTQRAVAVKYVLAEDAPMGKEIPLTLTVQDDGGTRDGETDDTGTAEFKIVLGATPWYPIYELPCQEHATHQVKLTAPGQTTVVVYVTGGVLKPEHYFYSSTSGLASGVVYTAELRPWNPVQGVAGPVCGVDDPDDRQVEVPEYGLPGQGEVAITGPDAATGKYTFAIKAPLAAGYVLTITRNGAAFKTITSNFLPNAEGLILPNVDLALDLFAAGTYSATVKGVNPKGTGEASEPAEVVVGAANATKLAWPADGVFVPASGKNIVVPSGTTTVKFSWPVVSAATAYNFYLYDSYGKVVKVLPGLKVNAQSVEIGITENSYGSYTWWVEAVSGGNALASQTLSFRLIRQTDAPLVEKFTIAEGAADKLIMTFSQEQGALPAAGTISYEVQHYDASAKRWIMYLKKDGKSVRPVVAEDGTWSLRLPDSTLAVGDYVLIREYVNNVVQGNFVLYRITQTMRN